MSKAVKLIISILVCQGAGVIGSLFTSPAISTWYATLQKPSFNPPNWIFAPVWILLFLLMGISLYLIWEKRLGNKKAKIAVFIFGVQLILNTFWSILFFGLQFPLYAFIEIIILWLAILLTIVNFYKISKLATYLLLPYILWVSFAGYLNYSIWQLQINAPEPVACTMDAKLCSDGSYVGRIAPKCDFAACPETRTIKLYYYNSELDRDEFGNTACSRNGLVPVEREISITETPIQDAIKLLLSGELTNEERAQGIDTEYPLEGLSLKDALLKDGVLTLEFDDSRNKTVGGSCRVGILWFQIEATAKQFPEVQQVHFLPEEIFQP